MHKDEHGYTSLFLERLSHLRQLDDHDYPEFPHIFFASQGSYPLLSSRFLSASLLSRGEKRIGTLGSAKMEFLWSQKDKCHPGPPEMIPSSF